MDKKQIITKTEHVVSYSTADNKVYSWINSELN